MLGFIAKILGFGICCMLIFIVAHAVWNHEETIDATVRWLGDDDDEEQDVKDHFHHGL